MVKIKISQPTDRELEILGILWKRGPCTVKQVNEEMNKNDQTGYTTTLKLMQIMLEKGLLVRDDSKYKHIYKPALSEEKTQRQLVGDMLNKAFSGSAAKLVMRLLSSKKLSSGELDNIKQFIKDMEAK